MGNTKVVKTTREKSNGRLLVRSMRQDVIGSLVCVCFGEVLQVLSKGEDVKEKSNLLDKASSVKLSL